jgi:hypothetical protein
MIRTNGTEPVSWTAFSASPGNSMPSNQLSEKYTHARRRSARRSKLRTRSAACAPSRASSWRSDGIAPWRMPRSGGATTTRSSGPQAGPASRRSCVPAGSCVVVPLPVLRLSEPHAITAIERMAASRESGANLLFDTPCMDHRGYRAGAKLQIWADLDLRWSVRYRTSGWRPDVSFMVFGRYQGGFSARTDTKAP